MLGVLKELKSWVKVSRRSSDHVSVDTFASALHHRITFTILLICCALLTSRQYFGDPILCIQDSSDDDAAIPSNVLNTYCFVTSSYTVVGPTGAQYKEPSVVAVGIQGLCNLVQGLVLYSILVLKEAKEHYLEGSSTTEKDMAEGETWQGHGDAERRHAYYQWMPFVLFLQSLLFASPHAAWRNWEGGLVHRSLMGLKDEVHGPNRDKLRTLAHYFAARLHTFHIWAAGFYICELLNLLNVVANMFFTDKLLGGNFYEYGLQLRQYGLQTLEGSPADVVFPKLTKCLFQKYGPSGTIQIHDALCVMALNIVNEKLFMVLWYWFALLALVSGLALLWRLLILGLLVCASAHSRSFMSVLAQRALGTPVTLDPVYLSPVTQRLDCGDWLFLQLLGANMGTRVYREFMEQLVQAMEQVKQSDLQPIWNS